MDEVFKALNDPSRRVLLDALFERDGQTLGALSSLLPGMTRYGVMNHLRVLEEAHLITTRRSGREKHHYLNPVPIRLVHDRWIGKYMEPVVGALARMTTELTRGGSVTVPDHVYQTFIDCTVAEAWEAIVDGDKTVQYYYGTRVESTWEVGAPIRYLSASGEVVADGEILAFEPPHRLEITFHARWDPEIESEGPVRMTWAVAPADALTTVTVEFSGAPAGTRTHDDFVGGLPLIVSGMKTLLETGAPLGAR